MSGATIQEGRGGKIRFQGLLQQSKMHLNRYCETTSICSGFFNELFLLSF